MTLLLRGYSVTVDCEDVSKIMSVNWYIKKHKSNIYFEHEFPRGKKLTLHRFIMGLVPNDGKQIDHKNGNTLDNRKCNLRICTSAQNRYNTRISPKNTSGFKGVSWHAGAKKWVAQIQKNRKQHYMGLFNSAELAYKAYCEKAKELFGEFARFN